jgi:hypothetical protein
MPVPAISSILAAVSTKAYSLVSETAAPAGVFRASSPWVIVLMAGLGAIVPSLAEAQGVATAVLPFEGSGGLVVRRSVIHALEDLSEVSVIDEGLVDAAVERTGASTTGTAGIDGLARQLSVRLVIQGEVAGRPTRRSLDLVARDATGRQVASEHARLPAGGAGRRALDDALRQLLDAAIPQLGEAREAPEEHPIATRPTTTTTTTTTTTEEHTASSGPSGPSTSTGEWGEDPALLTLAAGIVVRARDATVSLTDGTTRSYALSPYVEVHARIETRPLAHEQSYARGLYAYGEFGYGLGVTSRRTDNTEVPTTFYRFGIHAGYLVPFAQVFEVGAGVGFGYEAYELGPNPAMPTAIYPYLRPAIRARVRTIGEMLVLNFEAGYRALFGRGALSEAYGPGGDSFGYDIGGGVTGTFDFGLYYGVDFSWVQFVHNFAGTPASIGSGEHGTDGGYRLTLSVGYAIR